MTNTVKTFGELSPDLYKLTGGKGAMLSHMYRMGYPVPPGFVIMPSAFTDDKINTDALHEIEKKINDIRKNHKSAKFAVRSSALSEDSAAASFAGGFETVLNCVTDNEIISAVSEVVKSAGSERIKTYSKAQNLSGEHTMAVVVQLMVNPAMSGVLFTVNPVSGSPREMTGNYIRGLGEQLVSGERSALDFSFFRPGGKYSGNPELKPYVRKMYKTALSLEKFLGAPQDIEWAIANKTLYILQARPITTLSPGCIERYEINDSFMGDELWVNANVGEAVPEVATPFTWSVIRRLDEAATFAKGYYIWSGNICGRIYSNYGRRISALIGLGFSESRAKKSVGSEMFGKIPAEVKIPVYPYSKKEMYGEIMPRVFSFGRAMRRVKKIFNEEIKNNPTTFAALEGKTKKAKSCAELLEIWHEDIVPYINHMWCIQGIGGSNMLVATKVKNKLLKLVDKEQTSLLLSGIRSSGTLESMGPLIGIGEIFYGRMSREEYLRKYGHRSPYELEFSIPHPAENTEWLDKQIEEYESSGVNLNSILKRQEEQYQQAVEFFIKKYPARKKWLEKQLKKAAKGAQIREKARSEFTRGFRINRAFACKAAELIGIGDDIFFLYIDEVLSLLSGDKSCLKWIVPRRENYEKYKKLPPFPPVIRGRFDPFIWVKNPNRQIGYFDAEAVISVNEQSDLLTGFPGSAGVVEGVVRVLDSSDEGKYFCNGEILVTHTTNIGWTPLFPRAAAIVTDVGAPLSHAAIVARELGVPAVVGCGNATMRLKTGDRIIVNGGQGVVQIL